MKTTIVFTLLILNCAPAFAGTFSVPDIGVAIDLPEGWTHDPSDGFGYLIRPPKNASVPKMRIHKLSHVGISPEEAIAKGIEKVNGMRVARKEAKETLISSEHFRTKSGIDGARGVIGPGDDYLNRYYFKHPKTDVMFCVCIYKSRNHAELTQTLEDAIKQSLRITKPAKG